MSESNEVEMAAMKPIPYTLYYGTFIHTPNLGELKVCLKTLVGVNKLGTIDFIHENYDHDGQLALEFFKQEYKKQGNQLDPSELHYVDISDDATIFFCPGFVDTHIHASQYPNVGIGLGCQLLDWLKNYTYKLENGFTNPKDEECMKFSYDVYHKIIKKTLENGTTCASYFTTIDPHTTMLFARLLLKLGQRGFVGKVCMDSNDVFESYQEDQDDCVKSMELITSYYENTNPKGEQLIKPIITPRFAPVCSLELLEYLGSLAATKEFPIQTHISESHNEIELVARLFPEFDNYASVYDNFKLLNSSTILAHGVHLNEKERKLIKSRNCSISHCPTSNTFIASGEAPVKKYLYEDKINVSVGSDVSGGYSPSILEVIKQTILVSHHLSIKTRSESASDPKLSVADAIYMATQAGAKAVGLDNIIGSFDIGKRWDAQMINLSSANSNIDIFPCNVPDLKNINEDTETGVLNLLGKWIFCGDDRNCVMVWCNGRLVISK